MILCLNFICYNITESSTTIYQNDSQIVYNEKKVNNMQIHTAINSLGSVSLIGYLATGFPYVLQGTSSALVISENGDIITINGIVGQLNITSDFIREVTYKDDKKKKREFKKITIKNYNIMSGKVAGLCHQETDRGDIDFGKLGVKVGKQYYSYDCKKIQAPFEFNDQPQLVPQSIVSPPKTIDTDPKTHDTTNKHGKNQDQQKANSEIVNKLNQIDLNQTVNIKNVTAQFKKQEEIANESHKILQTNLNEIKTQLVQSHKNEEAINRTVNTIQENFVNISAKLDALIKFKNNDTELIKNLIQTVQNLNTTVDERLKAMAIELKELQKILKGDPPTTPTTKQNDTGFFVIQMLIITAFAICFIVLMVFAVWRQRFEEEKGGQIMA